MQAFGDGFDLYAAITDAASNYWDSSPGSTNTTLVGGRFTGSRALQIAVLNTAGVLVKSSGANDAVHHVVCAFQQTAGLSGTTLGMFLQLVDGTTNQCCIVFRSDGAILLTSGGPAGTVLATYTGAVTAANTWFAFELEVVINNTTGSFSARKNGNASNDFSLGSLNTRGGTTNNYANKIILGMQATVAAQVIDDLLWRSDPTSVPWVGDIRCYTRMPGADVSKQFSPVAQAAALTGTSTASIVSSTARYSNALTMPVDGTIGTVVVNLTNGYTGNMKCTLFTYTAAGPTTILQTAAAAIANPVTGNNTFSFTSPPTLVKGTQISVGTISDTSGGSWTVGAAGGAWTSTAIAYATFPVASPGSLTAGAASIYVTANITPTDNYSSVNEAQEDGTSSYVYDSTVGHNDLYSIAAAASTPASVVCVTTRGFIEKSDAGARGSAVQLKSGATTVQSTATLLGSSFGWLWRTDLTDPNTSAAWVPGNVDNVQIGPVITS